MKCHQCGKIIPDHVHFCPHCQAKVTLRFKQKVEAQTKADEHAKKMKDKELARQQAIVKDKKLQNPFIIPAAKGIPSRQRRRYTGIPLPFPPITNT